MMYEELVEQKKKEWEEQPMLRPRIAAVKINMSLGRAGDVLNRGMGVLEELTGQKPVPTYAKQTWRKWGIRKGQEVGAKVTVRGNKAYELLMKLLHTKEYKVKRSAIDRQGNFGFGINEHIDIPGLEYDPNVGIFGFDVVVQMERAGYRVKNRSFRRTKIPQKQFLTPEDTIVFLIDQYGAEIV